MMRPAAAQAGRLGWWQGAGSIQQAGKNPLRAVDTGATPTWNSRQMAMRALRWPLVGSMLVGAAVLGRRNLGRAVHVERRRFCCHGRRRVLHAGLPIPCIRRIHGCSLLLGCTACSCTCSQGVPLARPAVQGCPIRSCRRIRWLAPRDAEALGGQLQVGGASRQLLLRLHLLLLVACPPRVGHRVENNRENIRNCSVGWGKGGWGVEGGDSGLVEQGLRRGTLELRKSV